MRPLLAVLTIALTIPCTAVAALAPVAMVNEYEGGTGWSCRWNPYAYWNGTWWVGQFQWYTLAGAPTGVPCV